MGTGKLANYFIVKVLVKKEFKELMSALEKENGEKIAEKLVNTIFQALQSF